MNNMTEELTQHLNALARDDCYVVDEVLKSSIFERTERVHFQGGNGAVWGPFVRKLIDREAGMGAAYQSIFTAQQQGRRFLYLPRIFDCHEAASKLVVVMEFVGGETLADVVYRCDPSVELACDIFPRLCDAVCELHECFVPPLIHRDLKPSNIMLSHESLTIIDFGIARSFNDKADEDTRHFGTRAYAPPEQFGYGQTNVRSDVYALGLLLYFCLTEKTPDAKARDRGYASKQIPEPLRRVIARATAFDPSARYTSVREFKQAFVLAVETTKNSSPYAPSSPLVPAQERLTPVSLSTLSPVPSFGGSVPASVPSKAPKQKKGFWAHIPPIVGTIWNVILLLAFIMFLIAAASATVSPSEGNTIAAYPLEYRVIGYTAITFCMVIPCLYLFSDRRPLKRLVPFLRSCSFVFEVLVCAACMLVGVIIFCVLTQVFPTS